MTHLNVDPLNLAFFNGSSRRIKFLDLEFDKNEYLVLHEKLLTAFHAMSPFVGHGKITFLLVGKENESTFTFDINPSLSAHDKMQFKAKTIVSGLLAQAEQSCLDVRDHIKAMFLNADCERQVIILDKKEDGFGLLLGNQRLESKDIQEGIRLIAMVYACKKAIFFNGRSREDMMKQECLSGQFSIGGQNNTPTQIKSGLGTYSADRARIYDATQAMLSHIQTYSSNWQADIRRYVRSK